MADERGSNSFCLLGVHIPFSRLSGVHTPIPKKDIVNEIPSKKRPLIKIEPTFFYDDRDHDQSRELMMIKKLITMRIWV